jgi:cytochrome c553
MKKNSPFPVMNEKRRLMTDEAIRAVATHMMNLPDGQGYEFKGTGTLLWVPEGTVLKKIPKEEQL